MSKLSTIEEINANSGREVLVQTDWDYPAIARAFGWSPYDLQKVGRIITEPCHHSGTDGTVDCEDCGVTAHDFITAAGEWLRDHDGATAEDPGYFDQD